MTNSGLSVDTKPEYSVRPAAFPNDSEQIEALDSSFSTDTIYEVRISASSIELVESQAACVFRYPVDIEEIARLAESHYCAVAALEGKIVGVAAAEFAQWNRRAIFQHLYVAPDNRGCGIGTALLQNAVTWAKSREARCLWLETQNINYPAIEFYSRFGFKLCGYDAALYDPTVVDPRHVALFYSLPLE